MCRDADLHPTRPVPRVPIQAAEEEPEPQEEEEEEEEEVRTGFGFPTPPLHPLPPRPLAGLRRWA